MNQSTIAAKLLTLFVSGGTFERAVAELPMFKAQIESALDWMKTAGRCSATEIAERAVHLRGIISRKDEAIKHRDFDLAATIRAEECAVFESFGWRAPTGDTWHTILHVAVDEQTRQLSASLRDTNAA
jgi:hypothetical protein